MYSGSFPGRAVRGQLWTAACRGVMVHSVLPLLPARFYSRTHTSKGESHALQGAVVRSLFSPSQPIASLNSGSETADPTVSLEVCYVQGLAGGLDSSLPGLTVETIRTWFKLLTPLNYDCFCLYGHRVVFLCSCVACAMLMSLVLCSANASS